MKASWIVIFSLISLFHSMHSHGQGQDSQWIFGNQCWVDFSGSGPLDMGNGLFNANEGVVSQSDSEGQLLFLSNGESVFDRNGALMPNGNALGGHWSATQSTLVVPKPGDREDRFYYLFTIAAEAGNYTPGHTGLEYVLIDMNLNNGLGDVAGSSVELVADTGEKLHATWHTNQRDVWVVTHTMDTQEYHAFLLTCDGIDEHVVSASGRIHASSQFGQACTGAMKLSSTGQYIASVYNGNGPDGGGTLSNYLEFGHFNSFTGEVQIVDEILKLNGFGQGYGLEFSPNGSKLYWSIMSSSNLLFQYDIEANSLEEGEFQFSTSEPNGHALAGMQLGPDGRIYIARSHNGTFLSALTDPDQLGAQAGFLDEAVALSRPCRFGLPNQWMYPYPEPLYNVEQLEIEHCRGDEFYLVAPSTIEGPYLWNTGESGLSIISQSFDTHWVTGTGCSYDTVFYELTEPPYCDCQLYVPNSFTPNGDGVNDSFGATLWCDVDDFKFTVYDRWGQQVFESAFISRRWDGSADGYYLPDGVYTWKAEWTDNRNGLLERKREMGSVTILR